MASLKGAKARRELSGRVNILILLLIIVPLGFACKFYAGPFQFWVRNSLGGVFYEMFWCLAIAFIWPRRPPLSIALIVLLATSALEALQLWHPPFLEAIRRTFIGRTLIGTTFVWSDFAYYVIGSAIGWGILVWVQKKRPRLGSGPFTLLS